MDKLEYNPFYGQFIIGCKRFESEPLVSHVLIKDGIWLSYGDGLGFQHAKNSEGKSWYLLGEAYQSDPDQLSPVEELRNATLANIEEVASLWAGRWLLIGYDRIFTDASAYLKCFYKKDLGAGGYFFASNPILFCEIDGEQNIADFVEDKKALIEEWPVPPRSGYKDTRVLLPTQCINIYNGTIEPRKVLYISQREYSYEESIDKLIKMYSSVLKNIAARNNNIWVPLTGGEDSRFVVAMAYYSGINIKTYTFNKPYFRISNSDKNLPPVISKLAGFEHHLINQGTFSEERKRIFDRLSPIHRTIPGTCYYYFVNGYWEYFKGDVISLNGFCGELGRCYLHKSLFPNPSKSDFLKLVPVTPFNKIAIDELVEWWSHSPQINLDDRDRFYWEGRMAGWISSVMLQESLTSQFYKIKRIPILNCAKALRITLAMDESHRKGGKYDRDIVGRILPQVKNIPYNPRNYFKWVCIQIKYFIVYPRYRGTLLLHWLLAKIKKS
jgi:hypothetical protein